MVPTASICHHTWPVHLFLFSFVSTHSPHDPPTHPPAAGVYFGPDITQRFCAGNQVSLVVRSHECVQEGYQFMHDNRLVTVFSASHYCGRDTNKGAFIIFEPDMSHTIQQVRAVLYRLQHAEQLYGCCRSSLSCIWPSQCPRRTASVISITPLCLTPVSLRLPHPCPSACPSAPSLSLCVSFFPSARPAVHRRPAG